MTPRRLAIAGIDKDLIDALRGDPRYVVAALFDPAPVASACGIPVIGGDDAFAAWIAGNPDARYVMAVDIPALRRKLVAGPYASGTPETLICRHAHVAPDATIGRGAIVMRGAVVSADATIGVFAKINADAAIHHDCVVGDYVTLAPGCRLLGNVAVGEGAYIGAAACVLPRKRVGANARLGAGGVAIHDIPAGVTATGVPARSRT